MAHFGTETLLNRECEVYPTVHWQKGCNPAESHHIPL